LRKILLVLLLALNLYGFTATDSLVAWYKLTSTNYGDTEAGKFTDLSGNGNHAESFGTVTFTDNHLGNSNSAMTFDGSSNYLNCGNSSDFNINAGSGDNYTVQAWLWIDEDAIASDNSVNISLFSKYSYGEDSFYLQLNSVLRTYYYQNSNYTQGYHEPYKGANWHLITLTFDFGIDSLTMYRNCNLIGKYDLSTISAITTNTGNFIIGAYSTSVFMWDGNISEFWFYNRLLNVSEMETTFSNSLPNSIDENFEEGSLIFTKSYWDKDIDGSSTIEIYTGEADSCIKATCNGISNYRAEITRNGGYSGLHYQQNDSHRWYSFDWKSDENYTFSSNEDWNCMSQFFEYDEDGSPVYAIHYNNDSITVTSCLYYNDSNEQTDSKLYMYNEHFGHQITKNTWYNIVYHVYASDDGTGYMEAWCDGEPLFPETGSWSISGLNYVISKHKLYGRNIQDDDDNGLRLKYGYYRSPNATTTNSVYYDNIKTGNTAESIGFMSAKYSDVTPSDDLVAHYKLREEDYNYVTGMFYDLSGNENHATANGTVNFTSNHLDSSNSAMVFDGSTNYLQIPHNTDLNIGTEDYSVLAWVKPTTIMNSNYLFSKGSGTDWFAYKFKNMRYSTIFTYQDGDYEGHEYIGSALIKDSYVLVGMSIHDDSVYVYKNGNLSAKDKYSGNLIANPTNTGDMYIGKMLTYASYFIGNIEEIKFYKRALTKTEMLDEFDDCMPHGIYDDLESSTMEAFWNLQTLGNGSWELDGSDPFSGDSCLKITHTGDADVLAHRIDYEEASSEYGSGVQYGETRWISCYWKADAGFTW